MTIDEFVEQMKKKVSTGLLKVSGGAKLSTRNWTFSGGRAEITVIRGGAIEKAAIQHLVLENISQPGMPGKLDAFVFHIKVFPVNPYCPMGHFNTEWVRNGMRSYSIVLDLFPAIPVKEDLETMKTAMNGVADKFGRDREKSRDVLVTQYNMEHFASPLAARVGLKLPGIEEKNLDVLFAAHETFLKVYLDIFNKRKDSPYTDSDVRLKLERNGKWLQYLMLKDGAVKAGRAHGIPPEVFIEMGFPPVASF
jgi:coproporphyrinogen III oxidase